MWVLLLPLWIVLMTCFMVFIQVIHLFTPPQMALPISYNMFAHGFKKQEPLGL